MPQLTTRVEIAWTSNPLSDPATATWSDISADVVSVGGAAGRSSEQDKCPAGTATVEVLDIDGDYDPANTGGANYPNVLPGRLLRVRVSDYADRILTDVPAGYWRLGESSGTTMVDSSGNGRDGTYYATPTLGATGALALETNTAVTFASASTEYAARAYTAALNPAAVSVSLWLKRSGGGAIRYAVDSRGSNKGYALRLTAAGVLEWVVGTGAAYQTVAGPTIADATWTHILATSTASAQAVYVNGALAATGSWAYAANTTAAFAIAADTVGGNTFNGTIDEVAVFGAALPAVAARHHYEMGAGLTAVFTGPINNYGQNYASGIGPAKVIIEATDVADALQQAPSPLDHEQVARRLKPARYFRFGEVAAGKLLDDGTAPQKGSVRTSTELEQDPVLGTALKCNSGSGGWPIELPGTNVGTADFTLSCWARSDVASYGAYLYMAAQDSGVYVQLQHWLDAVTGGTSSRSVTARVVRHPASRDWIHYAITRSSSAGTETVRLFVNGAEVGTAATGATVNVTATSTTIGSIAGSAMHVAHWALWTSALTAAQIDMLWQSGLPGWQAQTPEARIGTALSLAGWSAPTVLDSGSSRCAASRGGTALSVCQDAAQADEGLFLIDGRGRPTFHSRASRRRVGSTPPYTFGDSNTAGTTEVPYGDVEISNDQQNLWTAASVNGRYAEDATAAASYGRRSPGESSRPCLTARDSQGRAEGFVAAHKAAATRIERIDWTLPQTRGGALALQLEVNDWIRVVRRPRAGQTITNDCWVERRQWQIDCSNGPGNSGVGKVTCALSGTEPGQNSMLTFGTSTYAGTDTLAS